LGSFVLTVTLRLTELDKLIQPIVPFSNSNFLVHCHDYVKREKKEKADLMGAACDPQGLLRR
jgi:hypothetical protein